jgi:hypothetical protein
MNGDLWHKIKLFLNSLIAILFSLPEHKKVENTSEREVPRESGSRGPVEIAPPFGQATSNANAWQKWDE